MWEALCTRYPIYGGVFDVRANGMVRGKGRVSSLFPDKGSVPWID